MRLLTVTFSITICFLFFKEASISNCEQILFITSDSRLGDVLIFVNAIFFFVIALGLISLTLVFKNNYLVVTLNIMVLTIYIIAGNWLINPRSLDSTLNDIICEKSSISYSSETIAKSSWVQVNVKNLTLNEYNHIMKLNELFPEIPKSAKNISSRVHITIGIHSEVDVEFHCTDTALLDIGYGNLEVVKEGGLFKVLIDRPRF